MEYGIASPEAVGTGLDAMALSPVTDAATLDTWSQTFSNLNQANATALPAALADASAESDSSLD